MKNKRFSQSITIFHANQCDPKKCTGIRIWRYSKQKGFSTVDSIRFIKKLSQIPRFSLILNPLAGQILSFEDHETYGQSGLTVLDCSWNHTEEFFDKRFLNSRRLPYMLAANPVNYGKLMKLTSVEALAAALFLLRNEERARELLSIFRWGVQFFILNSDLLRDYVACSNAKDLRRVELEYFGDLATQFRLK